MNRHFVETPQMCKSKSDKQLVYTRGYVRTLMCVCVLKSACKLCARASNPSFSKNLESKFDVSGFASGTRKQ